MSKILFVLANLHGGGAQRTTILTANWLAEHSELKTEILLLDSGGELKGLVSPRVHLSNLGSVSAIRSVRKLREFLSTRKADVIVPAQNYVNVVVALSNWLNGKEKSTVLLWEKNIFPSRQMNMPGWIRTLLRISMSLTYPLADGLVCNSPDTLESLRRAKIRLPDSVSVVPNMAWTSINEQPSESPSPEPHNRRFFLAVGRLTFQKGFDLLLEAFARMDETDIDLVILGEGELEERLLQLARALGVGSRVFFPGFVPNPRPYYENCLAFVMSSRWEGFGNVIVEALQAGAPIISFDCPGGPRWILGEGKFGELVPAESVDSLTNSLDNFLTFGSQIKREDRVSRGLQFAPEEVGRDFLRLLRRMFLDV